MTNCKKAQTIKLNLCWSIFKWHCRFRYNKYKSVYIIYFSPIWLCYTTCCLHKEKCASIYKFLKKPYLVNRFLLLSGSESSSSNHNWAHFRDINSYLLVIKIERPFIDNSSWRFYPWAWALSRIKIT